MKLIVSESGSALVEFSCFLSLLLMLFLGVVDYGLALQRSLQVVEAASAGAAYGSIPGNQKDLNGMMNAARAAASGVSGFSVTAANVFTCTPGGAAVSSGASCTRYGTPIEYVVVSTSATIPAVVAWSGLANSFALKGTASFRVPWTP